MEPGFKAFIQPHPEAAVSTPTPPEPDVEYEPHTPLEDPPPDELAEAPSAEPPAAPAKEPPLPRQCASCPIDWNPPAPQPSANIGLGYVIPKDEILWLAGGAWLLGAIAGGFLAYSFSKPKVGGCCPMME